MNKIRLTLNILTTVIVSLTISSVAQGQATRTWVSGTGDDANPCTRIEPCRTFAAALAVTAAGGEISAMDAGSYGPVTINKSVTISGTGTLAGIIANSTDAITINTGPNDVVILRNLDINGLKTGLNGIRFVLGAALFVENCNIYQFSQTGIDFRNIPAVTDTARLFVKNTVISNNNPATGVGILVEGDVGITSHVNLDNVRLERNGYGLRAQGFSLVTASNSVASGNTNNGFLAIMTGGGAAEIQLESCVASNQTNNSNNAAGIQSSGSLATIRISNVTVVSNNIGLLSSSGGTILSFGNNRIHGNSVNGAPTVVITQQ